MAKTSIEVFSILTNRENFHYIDVMTEISSIKALIKCWPTRKDLADDLAVSKERVDKWAQTESIPARFHAAVIRAAAVRGIAVTAADLVRLHDSDAAGEAA